MKKLLILWSFILVVLMVSCSGENMIFHNIDDCKDKLSEFEAKLASESYKINSVITITYMNGISDIKDYQYNIIPEPYSIEAIKKGVNLRYICVDGFIYQLQEFDGKKLMFYDYGNINRFLEYVFVIDFDNVRKIKDIDSVSMKSIKNGFNISYDTLDYFENNRDENYEDLLYKNGIRSILGGTVSIDYTFTKNSLNLKCFYDIIHDDEHSYVNFDISFTLEDVKPYDEEFYLELSPTANDVTALNIVDVTGYTKLFTVFSHIATKMHLEAGTYHIECNAEGFNYIIYDSNLKPLPVMDSYTLESGMYYIYFDNLNQLDYTFIEVIKE